MCPYVRPYGYLCASESHLEHTFEQPLRILLQPCSSLQVCNLHRVLCPTKGAHILSNIKLQKFYIKTQQRTHMSQLNYYNHSENCHSQEYNNLIRAFATITEGLFIQRLHHQGQSYTKKSCIDYKPNASTYFACGIMDSNSLIACNTTAPIPLEGKWCAAEGSVVSGIHEGCDHRFQKIL